jgi:hypothetical protein
MIDLNKFYRNIFFMRRDAYRKTFDPKDQYAKLVLADLRRFCRGTGSKYMGDRDKTHVMIGRNEVWERINTYCNIPDEDIAKLVEQYND